MPIQKFFPDYPLEDFTAKWGAMQAEALKNPLGILSPANAPGSVPIEGTEQH